MQSRVDSSVSRFSSLRSSTYKNVAGNRRALIWYGNRLIRRNTCFQKKDPLRMKIDNGGTSVKVHSAPENSEGIEFPMSISGYHPFEEMDDPVGHDGAHVNASHLSDAQIARTIVEVNNKAAIELSLDDDFGDSFTYDKLSYSTDEHGDIYFEVDKEEEVLMEFAGDRIVKVVIGLDTSEMIVDDRHGIDAYDFDMDIIRTDDYIYDDESDSDDEDDDDIEFFIVDHESEEEPNWSVIETLKSVYPPDFAKSIAQAVCGTKIDWTNYPASGIVVKGYLRPAFSNEQTMAKRNKSTVDGENDDIDQNKQDGSTHFLKLELENIQLTTACGNQTTVSIQEFWGAKPDVIAHSAANIISRLKAGGEKITQALKSICWRNLGLQVEATSEFGAEKQVHDLLFPRIQEDKRQQQASQHEC
ncbi:uncharacterized protein At3g49140-like isoform X6 [Carex rostrata]